MAVSSAVYLEAEEESFAEAQKSSATTANPTPSLDFEPSVYILYPPSFVGHNKRIAPTYSLRVVKGD